MRKARRKVESTVKNNKNYTFVTKKNKREMLAERQGFAEHISRNTAMN